MYSVKKKKTPLLRTATPPRTVLVQYAFCKHPPQSAGWSVLLHFWTALAPPWRKSLPSICRRISNSFHATSLLIEFPPGCAPEATFKQLPIPPFALRLQHTTSSLSQGPTQNKNKKKGSRTRNGSSDQLPGSNLTKGNLLLPRPSLVAPPYPSISIHIHVPDRDCGPGSLKGGGKQHLPSFPMPSCHGKAWLTAVFISTPPRLLPTPVRSYLYSSSTLGRT